MSIQEVNYLGVILEVKIDYIPADGDGRNDPYVPAHFVAESVTHNGGDISEMLTGQQWKDIEALIEDEIGVAA